MIIGCMIYILSMFFSSVAIANLGLLILLSIITSIIFAIAGLINAFIARSFDDISWFPSFILTPMIFFGGLFYNIDNLSQKWQKISSFNPLFHILQIYRSCFFEEINCNVSLVLTLMVASMLLIYAIAIRLLNQDIRK